NVTVPVSETYQGWVLNISATVTNLGNASESFSVTLSYNSTSMATLPVNDMAPNATQTLVFSWNTTNVRCGNYTMEAETAFAPSETNAASNVLVDGALRINLLGDVNGEGKVDMNDIMTILNAFGSYPGHARWNAACDLNQDGRIDLADIVLALMNFGKTS
ncbi:MAG TPA: CARDB domain-containing protein, partial [Candidatus Acidoferrales bacterium]|nr:CARDB domain-containing protein [Candidatus Acidoferrales bacterium]